MLSRHEREKVEKIERGLEDLASRVQTLERMNDRLEAQAEAYRTTIAMLREEQAMLVSTHQDAIRAFSQVSAQYTDGLARARETIAELSAAEPQSAALQNRPLHKSEEEEDLEFQLDHGVLNLAQYNEALRAAGLSDD
jgi:predicted RNase H-like nuclease (RuvC/YqgF family)